MTASTRYWLFQLPGWTITSLVLYGFHRWFELPGWGAAAIMVVLVVKDAVLFPFLRHAYDTNVKTGVEQLVGHSAVTWEDLSPEGFVRIRGELWRARLGDPAQTVPAGSTVRVESGKGLLLIVSARGDLQALDKPARIEK